MDARAWIGGAHRLARRFFCVVDSSVRAPPPKGVVCSSFPRSGLVEGYDGRACVANSTGLLFSFSSAFARQRPAVAAWRKFAKGAQGPVAQWIRHRPTEPGIAGLSPAGVICASHPLHARPAWRLPRVFWSCGKSAGDVSATNRSQKNTVPLHKCEPRHKRPYLCD